MLIETDRFFDVAERWWFIQTICGGAAAARYARSCHSWYDGEWDPVGNFDLFALGENDELV